MRREASFHPVKRLTVPEIIIDQLKTLIAQGDLRPGDQLPSEMELARLFSVGRTSIREAIKALTFMGVLVRTNVGTFVTTDVGGLATEPLSFRLLLQKRTVKDLYEARMILESEIAALVARRATADDMQALADQIGVAEATMADGDLSAHLESDMAFHRMVAEAADNVVLVDLYQVISDIFYRDRDVAVEMLRSEELQQLGIQNHWRLLEAIRDRDEERARLVAVAGLAQVQELVESVLERYAGEAAFNDTGKAGQVAGFDDRSEDT